MSTIIPLTHSCACTVLLFKDLFINDKTTDSFAGEFCTATATDDKEFVQDSDPLGYVQRGYSITMTRSVYKRDSACTYVCSSVTKVVSPCWKSVSTCVGYSP